MSTPQPGIFALGTQSHTYLEFDLRHGADGASLVLAIGSLREPRTTIGGVNLVVGFRPEIWSVVSAGAAPAGLAGFSEPRTGTGGSTLAATQHDAVVWLAGVSYDVVFDLARGVVAALGPVASLANEVVGWPYHRDLDLTGFIDGLENPSLAEAASVVAIPAGEPGEGGSVLLLQQWEHDPDAWTSLTTHVQEEVIGRRKRTGQELDPRPETSHVARTDQDRFGRILRRNIAYGTVTRHGTIFVGFSQDRARLDAMLDSMIGAAGEPHDRLTEFTHAVTGAYYFVPSSEALNAFGSDAGR